MLCYNSLPLAERQDQPFTCPHSQPPLAGTLREFIPPASFSTHQGRFTVEVVVSMAFRKFSHGVCGHLAGTGFGALKSPFVSQIRERTTHGGSRRHIHNPEWALRRKPWPPGCCWHHHCLLGSLLRAGPSGWCEGKRPDCRLSRLWTLVALLQSMLELSNYNLELLEEIRQLLVLTLL